MTKEVRGKMKRVYILAVIFVFVMVPAALFAKTAISDNDLSNVTAQTGVSISFSSLSVSNVSTTCQSWGDNDGFGAYSGQGWVGASQSTSGNVVGITGVMNIDVGTSGAQTRLKIDLPLINIGAGGMTQDQTIKLAADKTLTTNAGTLGMQYQAGVSATITGSIMIYAH
jgi:hypothetical protein